MKKTIAAFVSAAFLFGTTGFALAQTPAPAPTEKKAEDKAMDKKATKKKMTMEERKAACMGKAGTDEAKKTACEKRYTAKTHKMDKTDKMDKMESKKDASPEKK